MEGFQAFKPTKNITTVDGFTKRRYSRHFSRIISRYIVVRRRWVICRQYTAVKGRSCQNADYVMATPIFFLIVFNMVHMAEKCQLRADSKGILDTTPRFVPANYAFLDDTRMADVSPITFTT